MTIKHLGLTLKRPIEDLRLTRENYIERREDGSPIFSFGKLDDDALEKHIDRCMLNFDLNMAFFDSLDEGEFKESLDSYLEDRPSFVQVFNLSRYAGKPAVYLMVLDKYKQVYLGTTNDLKRRIQRHWNYKKPVDRLIFGEVNTSKLSIDSFRALDTTRVYARPTILEDRYSDEAEADDFEECYSLNRTATGFLDAGLKDAIVERIPRQLISFE